MDYTKVQQMDEEDEIDLLELWYLFRRKLKFIILFGIIGCLIAGAFTYYLIKPKYEATAKIYVVSASNDSVINLSDIQIGSNLAKDYVELILGRPVMESLKSNLKLDDYSITQIRNMISVTNPANTRILNITATTTDPVLSRDIANEMAKISVQWIPSIMETNAPNIAEDAITPTQKSSPSLKKNALIGGMALAALYFGVCVVQFLLDDSVKSADDMEKYFGLVPLTTIPENSEVTWGDSDEKARKTKKHAKGGK